MKGLFLKGEGCKGKDAEIGLSFSKEEPIIESCSLVES